MLHRFSFVVLTLAVCPGLTLTFGQEGEKLKETELKSSIKDAQESCCSANTLNFCKELGVPFDYLSDIGHRIHKARLAPDPVDLALCAKGLSVAEKVAGKQAAITSQQVMKEAIDLAVMRGISTELQALKALGTTGPAQDQVAKALKEAQAREKEEQAVIDSGERPRELVGSLRVVNHSHECLRIFVSGRFVGIVHEGRTRFFHVHDHHPHTHLAAYCEEAGHLVSTSCVAGHRHFANWHIH